VTSSGVTVTGWTFDPDSPTKVIEGSILVNGRSVGLQGPADDAVSELNRLYPLAGTRHGYEIPVSLSRGTSEVCVYGHNLARTPGNDALLGCQTITRR